MSNNPNTGDDTQPQQQTPSQIREVIERKSTVVIPAEQNKASGIESETASPVDPKGEAKMGRALELDKTIADANMPLFGSSTPSISEGGTPPAEKGHLENIKHGHVEFHQAPVSIPRSKQMCLDTND
jgi:hypothetical protein